MSWLNEWCFGPLDHFWSLAVEEHFYLVWPVVIYLLAPRNVARLCMAVVIGVFLARICASTVPALDIAVDVCTPFRCDALCMGALLSVMVTERYDLNRFRQVRLVLLPILIFIVLAIELLEKRLLSISSTLCPLIWMQGLLLLVRGKSSDRLSSVMRLGTLRWFGKYSYGMYVFQLPLATLIPVGTLKWTGLHPLGMSLLYVLGMFSLTSGLAYLSYHCFEKRLLALKVRFE
jgi:peptidoglycan/LPS O-acetylase OafA/YrhL